MKLIMSDRPIGFEYFNNAMVEFVDLSKLKISNCIGCFGCWARTPGKCVIRDDATKVYPLIASSKKVIYVSRICYGGYDSVMKTMIERAIPVQQAFIRIHNGETHHFQRAVAEKDATIIAYGDIAPEEKAIFRQLVARNAHNMNFKSYEIVFTTEAAVEEAVKQSVEKWDE